MFKFTDTLRSGLIQDWHFAFWLSEKKYRVCFNNPFDNSKVSNLKIRLLGLILQFNYLA
jgi:hypothetical protein